MKFNVLTLLALGFATVSQAATYDIYISGSTAGRSSVHKAIQSILTGEVAAWTGNADVLNASQANFTGGTIGAGTDIYNIHTSWSGSVTGIQPLTNGTTINFMTVTAPGQTSTPGSVAHAVDIGYADIYQNSTNFRSPTLVDEKTLVLPFLFFTNEGSTITNVTPQLAQVLFKSGAVPLALFTGNPADKTTGVIAAGRDNSSGTRITTFAETGLGAFGTVQQFSPTLSFTNFALTGVTTNGTTTVTHNTGTALTVNQPIRGTGIPVGAKVASITNPTTFVLNVAAAAGSPTDVRAGQLVTAHTYSGNGGSTSGGTVAGWVAATTDGFVDNDNYPQFTKLFYLSYLGTADADATALPNGAVSVPYNGVPYTPTNVQEGKYTLWGYLHQYRRDDASAQAITFYDELKTQLLADPGLSGLSNAPEVMFVERQSDGANVTPLY